MGKGPCQPYEALAVRSHALQGAIKGGGPIQKPEGKKENNPTEFLISPLQPRHLLEKIKHTLNYLREFLEISRETRTSIAVEMDE